jgi:leader peptidase (prepilin peptidase)/N-methyltransferase
MMEALQDARLLMPLAVVLGLTVGSFLNVVIHRLPKILHREWASQCAELRGEPAPAVEPLGLAFPGSHCPACGAKIRPLDNIPILSYLVLGGRCRECHRAISIRYPSIEALTALLTVLAAWHFGWSLQLAGACIFLWGLIALAFIDLDTQLLPDAINQPLLWAGLAFSIWAPFADVRSAVIGAIGGYLFLWSVYWLFKITTGKEGMGYGDFKLLAAIGGWLGWKVIPAVIFLASVVGAIVGVMLIALARHGRNVPIPFGPYLAAAGALALFAGPTLVRAYMDML